MAWWVAILTTVVVVLAFLSIAEHGTASGRLTRLEQQIKRLARDRHSHTQGVYGLQVDKEEE